LGDQGEHYGKIASRFGPNAFIVFSNPFVDVGRTPARFEIFPRQSIAAAKIVAGSSQLQPEHFAEKAAAPVVTGKYYGFFRECSNLCRKLVTRGSPQGQIDGTRQVPSGKFRWIALIYEDRAFFSDQLVHVWSVEQDIMIAVLGNGAQLRQGPVLESSQRTAFDNPFFQSADHKPAVDPLLCKCLTGFPTAISVVAEESPSFP
jgi:hypothetical protein